MITVCMATFNGEPYVAKQLASILQSPLVDEVLISDDGSSDKTLEIVLERADSRVRLLSGPRRGLVRNYEHLLGSARGDLVFLADQDDVWMPEKVQLMALELRTCDLALSDCQVVDEDLNVLSPSFFALRGSRPGLLKNLAQNSYLGCCMAFNRRLLNRALPFPHRLPMHDWWLGLVAEVFGTVAFLPQPLTLYRRHGANASSTSHPSTVGLKRQMAWRLRMAASLANRWVERGTSHGSP